MSPPPHGFPITVFDVVTSTNDSVLDLGATEAPEGSTHIALSQTGGRGRSGRRWWSPAGAGLCMSTLLRPRRERAVWGGISLLAGAAVRRALVELGVQGVELYWPNDLQAGHQKIGGILGEVRQQAEQAWIAVGIGINIDLTTPEARAHLPSDVARLATSMVECGNPRTTSPLEIAQCILERLWPVYEQFHAGKSIPELVGTHLAHIGRRVTIRTGQEVPWCGVVRGLGEHGELLVEPTAGASETADEPGSVVAVTGGEVLYGNPADETDA